MCRPNMAPDVGQDVDLRCPFAICSANRALVIERERARERERERERERDKERLLLREREERARIRELKAIEDRRASEAHALRRET